LWQDSKSALQEKVQDVDGVTPYYAVVKETGPDHDKHFVVGVYIKDVLIAEGAGKSKQEAEQSAAEAASRKKVVKDMNTLPDKNQFFDINKLPGEKGLLVFGLSMSKLSNRQNAENC